MQIISRKNHHKTEVFFTVRWCRFSLTRRPNIKYYFRFHCAKRFSLYTICISPSQFYGTKFLPHLKIIPNEWDLILFWPKRWRIGKKDLSLRYEYKTNCRARITMNGAMNREVLGFVTFCIGFPAMRSIAG